MPVLEGRKEKAAGTLLSNPEGGEQVATPEIII